MASPTATSADTFFEEKGIVLPYHLTTRRKRWASLLVVCVCSAFASGPFASWPTLEPILTSEGVFAGPDQTLKLTLVMTIGVSSSAISQLFAGILYDAMGPRLLAGGSCCLICIGLLVMALAVHFQSLNPLLYVAYPIVLALSCMNNMGGYAWLYLLPVFLHGEFHIGLPVYFTICACLSVFAACICFWLIPSRQFNRQVAAAVQSSVSQSSGDLESHTYGATESSIPDSDAADEGLWHILKRTGIAWRDSCKCMVGLFPFAYSVYFLGYGFCSFMYLTFPSIHMFPFYKALLGKSEATTLVDIWGGQAPIISCCFILFLGRAVQYFGFKACYIGLLIIYLLALTFFSVPQFTAQIFAQVFLACYAQAWTVMQPVFVLAYAPPELYGTLFGLYSFISGVLQLPFAPLAVLASSRFDYLVTGGHTSTALVLLTTYSLWCFLTVFFGLVMLIYWIYCPMPEVGATRMSDVNRAWSKPRNDLKKGLGLFDGFAQSNKEDVFAKPNTNEDVETHPLQAAAPFTQAVSRSRTPTCSAPCLSGSWICAKRSGS